MSLQDGAELARSVIWLLEPAFIRDYVTGLALGGPEEPRRPEALSLLRWVCNSRSLEVVEALLEDEDDDICERAASLLDQLVFQHRISPKMAEPHLVRSRAHRLEAVRTIAAFVDQVLADQEANRDAP